MSAAASDATPRAPTGLDQLLATKEIAVLCGSGGVGKTSVAAATAVAAASQLGGKVLVLTVDPARRLAAALGLEGIGNTARRVHGDAFKEAGLEPRGELWAAMLDTKQSWDELVLRHAPDDETAYRILDNSLYQNITARFVQSHDYIAMERLFDLHQQGEYDLIVVDTPPTRNALDFLEAPRRMSEFFGGRLLRWLTMPYRVGGRKGARFINFASRPFYQVADRILGSEFLEDIGEFFLEFQSMYEGFATRADAVEQLMHDRRTTFAVVTTLEPAPLHEAEVFIRELRERDFSLGALVLNRTLPDYLRDPVAGVAAGRMVGEPGPVAEALAETGTEALADVARTTRVLRTIGDSFRNFAVLAKREAELRAELAQLPDVVARVPDLEVDVHDLGGLAAIGGHLFGE